MSEQDQAPYEATDSPEINPDGGPAPGESLRDDGPETTASAELETVRRERDELQNKLLRTMADYQNFARRSEQSIAGVREQQAMEFGRTLVTVLDNFDLALGVDANKASAKDVLQGVELVRGEFLKALGKFGVERIDATPGEAFDPNRHEALMRQKAEGIETNHVVAQFQPGYVIKDKTIRPAKVSVAE